MLTFLFGPIGLFYLGAAPGLVGLFVLMPLAIVGGFLTFGVVAIVVWFGCMVWAAVRAGHRHSTFEIWLAQRRP